MHPQCIFVGSVGSPHLARIKALVGAARGVQTSSLADWMSWAGPAAEGATRPVLLVAADQFECAEWRFVRVRLAEAGRFFVALLPEGAGTAATVAALREGAYDAVAAGEADARWRDALEGARSAEQTWARLFPGPAQAPDDPLVGHSPALRRVRDLIARVGPTKATVLLLGESGTGKEVAARALHDSIAGAASRPFVAINCTALPRDLLEGELFGAAKGAFTGAVADRPGLVEQADGGTLFLDEIGDLDPALQPKLLRFLETRRARRLGARSDYAVDVRIIAATNADLRARVAAGRFREDLYYRLAEISIELPPLRERPEDIPALCRHFLGLASERHDRVVTSIEPALVERLQTWSWPGNIRELRATIERLVLLSPGPVLRDSAWSPPPAPAAAVPVVTAAAAVLPQSPDMAVLNKRQRREAALRLLEESGGDQTWVAARLGIHPTTLYRWRQAMKPTR